ncbi:hypothetical protein D3C80_1557730 [compost metagenome]
MFGQQLQALGQHDGLDAVAHEVAVPFIQLRHVGGGEDFQAKVQVLGQVELAGQVILIELVVTSLVDRFVENAACTEIIAPGVVAVATEQCVVEIE